MDPLVLDTDTGKLAVAAVAFGLQILAVALTMCARAGRRYPDDLILRGDSLVASETRWRAALWVLAMTLLAGSAALDLRLLASSPVRSIALVSPVAFGVGALVCAVAALRPGQVRIGSDGVTVRALARKRLVPWPLIEADLGALARAGLVGLTPGGPRRWAPTRVGLGALSTPPPRVVAALLHNRDHRGERVSLPTDPFDPNYAPPAGLPAAPFQYIPSTDADGP